MLFAITLLYQRPKEDIEAHLDAHRNWLLDHTRAGSIVFAGPLEPAAGGFILAQGQTRAAIEDLMASDPFVQHALVSVAVLACIPAIRHTDFPKNWAPVAKAIPAS